MPWTTQQRDELEAAIASGVLTVEYSGPPARKQTYQSIDAMLKVLALMNRQLEGAPTYRLASTRKGLDTSPRGRFGSTAGDGETP